MFKCCTPSSSSALPASPARRPAQTLGPQNIPGLPGLSTASDATFKKHCKYRANRPGQSRQHPLHPRHSLHHQHLGVPPSLTSPASPASLKPFKSGPLRVGFGGMRTWRASLRSSERFFLRKCGRRRCAENIAHTVICLIFPPVSAGLGRAAGDAFFGLIGLRCETRAALARASAGRKQARLRSS